MKHWPIIVLLSVIVSSLLFTGFQCGSAEETSAKLYMQRKEWRSAETALAKETEKNPSNAEAWYMLGQSRLRRGEGYGEAGNYDSMKILFTSMTDAYRKAQELSKEYDATITSERLYGWQKSINYGVTLYNKSVAASKDSAGMLRQKAIVAYEAAIAVEPDSLLAYKNAAVALRADGRTEEEISYLKKARARKNDPDVSAQIIQYYLDKAEEASAKGDSATAKSLYATSLTELAEARKADPGNTQLMDAMINIYIKLGKAAEAVPLMQEALDKDPNNKVYHYNLGVLLIGADKLPEAIGHFDAAIKIDPAYDIAYQNAGVAQMKWGDKLKTKAQEEAEAKKTKVDKSYQEHFKAAAVYFEKLVEMKPQELNYYDLLVSAYANGGDIKKAEEWAKKADVLRKK
jgi:tetratricopeptide (TPR) repeat protein